MVRSGLRGEAAVEEVPDVREAVGCLDRHPYLHPAPRRARHAGRRTVSLDPVKDARFAVLETIRAPQEPTPTDTFPATSDALDALVAAVEAQYAPLVEAVREWQTATAELAIHHSPDGVEVDEVYWRKYYRARTAEANLTAALVRLPLPEVSR